jgi:hypothetical protein
MSNTSKLPKVEIITLTPVQRARAMVFGCQAGQLAEGQRIQSRDQPVNLGEKIRQESFLGGGSGIGPVKWVLGSGSGLTLRAQVFVGLAWPGVRAQGMECGLCPKTRPSQAWAFGLYM